MFYVVNPSVPEDKVAEPFWHGVIFPLTTSPSGSGFMSKDVQVADIHGFNLFEGHLRLFSLARLSISLLFQRKQ